MDGMMPLIIGTLLAIAALMLVLAPLVSGTTTRRVSESDRRSNDARIADEEEQGSAIAALREIEFDRETGKLSDTDYVDLKQRYTRAALEELRVAEGPAIVSSDISPVVSEGTLSIDDAVEAAIARARESRRACSTCGPRPEIEATYCSNCGKYLPGACGSCGATVEAAGSQYCMNCGNQLAA